VLSRRVGIDQAKEVALDRVKKDHPEAANPQVESTELEGGFWDVKGSWSVSSPDTAGSMNFLIRIDAENGEVVKTDYRLGFFVGVV